MVREVCTLKTVNQGIVGQLRASGYTIWEGSKRLWESKDVDTVEEGIKHLQDRAALVRANTKRFAGDVGRDYGYLEFSPEKDLNMGCLMYTMLFVAAVNEDGKTINYPNGKRFAKGFKTHKELQEVS